MVVYGLWSQLFQKPRQGDHLSPEINLGKVEREQYPDSLAKSFLSLCETLGPISSSGKTKEATSRVVCERKLFSGKDWNPFLSLPSSMSRVYVKQITKYKQEGSRTTKNRMATCFGAFLSSLDHFPA